MKAGVFVTAGWLLFFPSCADPVQDDLFLFNDGLLVHGGNIL